MRRQDLDVVVVGAGITGVALGLALHRSGHRVRVLDHRAMEPFIPPRGFDQRIYAISETSQSFLDSVGGWTRMDRQRIQAIERMDIMGDRDGRLHFDAEPGKSLGHIVEAGLLLQGLMDQVHASSPDLVEAPVSITDVKYFRDRQEIHLDHGGVLNARLLVAADGFQSPLRARMGLEAQFHDYHQTAVVANYASAGPHGGAARQWFLPGEVLALLPMSRNHLSLVWSATEEHARELLSMSPEERTSAIRDVTEGEVGDLEEVSVPAGFDLKKAWVDRWVLERFALVGDAAHGVHPMAGQGLNLGLQDAHCLAGILASRKPGPDCGDLGLLRRYERSRKGSVLMMQGVTDGLFRLFGVDCPESWVQWRNQGLNHLEKWTWMKKRLADHAAGYDAGTGWS